MLDLRSLPWVEGSAIRKELRCEEHLLCVREAQREAEGGLGVAVRLLGIGGSAAMGLGSSERLGRSVGEGQRRGRWLGPQLSAARAAWYWAISAGVRHSMEA